MLITEEKKKHGITPQRSDYHFYILHSVRDEQATTFLIYIPKKFVVQQHRFEKLNISINVSVDKCLPKYDASMIVDALAGFREETYARTG